MEYNNYQCFRQSGGRECLQRDRTVWATRRETELMFYAGDICPSSTLHRPARVNNRLPPGYHREYNPGCVIKL